MTYAWIVEWGTIFWQIKVLIKSYGFLNFFFLPLCWICGQNIQGYTFSVGEIRAPIVVSATEEASVSSIQSSHRAQSLTVLIPPLLPSHGAALLPMAARTKVAGETSCCFVSPRGFNPESKNWLWSLNVNITYYSLIYSSMHSLHFLIFFCYLSLVHLYLLPPVLFKSQFLNLCVYKHLSIKVMLTLTAVKRQTLNLIH